MRVAIIGYGRMGKLVESCIRERADWAVAGIVDTAPGTLASLAKVERADVAIDFSYPGDLEGLLEVAIARKIPLVIGRTGLLDSQLALIQSAAAHIPLVQAGNFSLSVAVMCRVAREMAEVLGEGFDIEITETHHRGKLDAPSGTAGMLLRAVDPEGGRPAVYGREGAMKARGREIGVHALRGGTVCGEHSVHFLGEMESLTLSHRAESRQVFAVGALRAAAFASSAAPGLYTMEDVLFGGKA